MTLSHAALLRIAKTFAPYVGRSPVDDEIHAVVSLALATAATWHASPDGITIKEAGRQVRLDRLGLVADYLPAIWSSDGPLDLRPLIDQMQSSAPRRAITAALHRVAGTLDRHDLPTFAAAVRAITLRTEGDTVVATFRRWQVPTFHIV